MSNKTGNEKTTNEKATNIDELVKWDVRVKELVSKYGLNCYPQEFEICDHIDMLGYMAYVGMPSRYQHWSWGKSFERQKTQYDYGVAGLPYEMVINSNPCLAYLMRDNAFSLQILTIAHVYGHNDFFANNFNFTTGTKAEYTIEFFKSNARRVGTYIEDPSIGPEAVESAIDHAHAVSMNCRRSLAIKKRTRAEQVEAALTASALPEDPYSNIHPQRKYVQPDLTKIPLEPEEDILSFIADNHPHMPMWKRDILRIVESEAKYFYPQIETKIMNEGWASYWHYKLMHALALEEGLHIEFLIKHNQVLRPHPGGLNPYHLGFLLWNDIEKRWNEKAGLKDFDFQSWEMTDGRKKIFETRESERDISFIRRFMTLDIMRELHMFQHEKRGSERVVTATPDEDNWEQIRDSLIANIGSNGIPVIKIEDANYNKNGVLYLKHYHEGRDLLMEYAEQTLRQIQAVWEGECWLETSLAGKVVVLKANAEGFKVDKR